jgi:hypothetical protein
MDNIVTQITDFIRSIGIPIKLESFPEETVLPGIKIEHGGIVIDTEKLLYPGDILHEAGHLAVAPPDIRQTMHGALDPKQDFEIAGELMAIPWSYAAAIYLQIDPLIVFHADGYHGGGDSILDNFSQGRYFGLSTLQWAGMTYDEKNAKENGQPPFPHMIKWVRE